MELSKQHSDIDSSVNADLRFSGLIVAAVVVLIFILFRETTISIVDIWIRSKTYAHGFIILPITLWLIWDDRNRIVLQRPHPNFWMLLPLSCSGVIWLLANIIDVSVVQQFSLMAMVLCSVWAILGTQLVKAMAFPLGFLLLAVPVGEDLVQPLMEFTASFTVEMVKLSGIPVFRDGMFFTLPSGNWSVVEACSGIRYLIASVTLGLLYAYLTYQSLKRRVVFVALSFIVPIIANGLRAYMIVMIGHLSDMQLATGVDHLIYGWVFFGIVIFILFYFGHFWSQPRVSVAIEHKPGNADAGLVRLKSGLIAVLALSVVSIWPVISNYSVTSNVQSISSVFPELKIDNWKIDEETEWGWRPSIKGADVEYWKFYEHDGRHVNAYIGVYYTQGNGNELVTSSNMLVEEGNKKWRLMNNPPIVLNLHSKQWQVEQNTVIGKRIRLLVWRWYRIGDSYTSNSYVAKLLRLKDILLSGRTDAAVIVLSAPYQEHSDEALVVLKSFASSFLSKMESSINDFIEY